MTPTEEFENDSLESHQSSKSISYPRKYSYDERGEKSSSYGDQGYHSIEYNPEEIMHRRSGSAYSDFDDPTNLSLFRHQCSLPPSSRKSHGSSAARRIVFNTSTTYRASLPISPKYLSSYPCSRENRRVPIDYSFSRERHRNNRASVHLDGKLNANSKASTKVNHSLDSPAGSKRSSVIADHSLSNDSKFSHYNRLNCSDPVVQERRKAVAFKDDVDVDAEFDKDVFDESLILRNEPKTRSCRRWSQADTLVINSLHTPSSAQDFCIIDERVNPKPGIGGRIPYAAPHAIEQPSKSCSFVPPVPPSPSESNRVILGGKVDNLRRRSARSVSPESRKRETEAREKRQHIAQNLQKYVDQRRKATANCQSQADLSNANENDFWKEGGDVTNEKVSFIQLVKLLNLRTKNICRRHKVESLRNTVHVKCIIILTIWK
jgi:hypothetical protein